MNTDSNAWRTEWTQISLPMLILLLLIALIGATADWWMEFFGAKTGGASIWVSLASILGGIVGLLVFSLPGMLIGAIAAIAPVEYYRHGDWNKVLRAGSGYLVGYQLAMVVQVVLSLAMIVIFVLAIRF